MEMTNKIRLSYSKAMSFLGCKFKYNLIYNEGIRLKGKSYALQLGDVTHQMLQEINTGKFILNHNIERLNLPELADRYLHDQSETARLAVYEAYKLILGYQDKYKDSNYKVISSEVIMEADFGICTLYTRLDGITQIGNDYWRHEYKTTAKIDKAYLQGLKKGLQTGIAHIILKEVTKVKFRGSIFDLIVKTKVPQYERNPIIVQTGLLKRTEQTITGIITDIKAGNFYPSGQCFRCDFEPLCTAESKDQYNEVLKNFFEKKEDNGNEIKGKTVQTPVKFRIKC